MALTITVDTSDSANVVISWTAASGARSYEISGIPISQSGIGNRSLNGRTINIAKSWFGEGATYTISVRGIPGTETGAIRYKHGEGIVEYITGTLLQLISNFDFAGSDELFSSADALLHGSRTMRRGNFIASFTHIFWASSGSNVSKHPQLRFSGSSQNAVTGIVDDYSLYSIYFVYGSTVIEIPLSSYTASDSTNLRNTTGTARPSAITDGLEFGLVIAHGGQSEKVKMYVGDNLALPASPAPMLAPKNVSVIAKHDEITVTWEPPDNPPRTITGYQIQLDNGDYETVPGGATARTHTFQGLRPVTLYTITLATTDSNAAYSRNTATTLALPVIPPTETLIFSRDLEVEIINADGDVIPVTSKVSSIRFTAGLNISDDSMPLFAASRGQMVLETDAADEVLRGYKSMCLSYLDAPVFFAAIEDYDRQEFNVTLDLLGIGSIDRGTPVSLNILPSLTEQQTGITSLPAGAGFTIAEDPAALWWPFNAQGVADEDRREREEAVYTQLTFLRDFAAFGSLAVFENLKSPDPAYRGVPLPTSDRDKRTASAKISKVLADSLDVSDTSRWQSDAQSLEMVDSPFVLKTDGWDSNDTHEDGVRFGGSSASDKRKIKEKYGVSFPSGAKSHIVVGFARFYHGDLDKLHQFFGFTDVVSASGSDLPDGRSRSAGTLSVRISKNRRTLVAFSNVNDDAMSAQRVEIVAKYWTSEKASERETVEFYHDEDVGQSSKQFIPPSRIPAHKSDANEMEIAARLARWNEWDQPTVKARVLVHNTAQMFLDAGDLVRLDFDTFDHTALITRVGYNLRGSEPLLMDFDMILFKETDPAVQQADNYLRLDGQLVCLNEMPLALS